MRRLSVHRLCKSQMSNNPADPHDTNHMTTPSGHTPALIRDFIKGLRGSRVPAVTLRRPSCPKQHIETRKRRDLQLCR